MDEDFIDEATGLCTTTSGVVLTSAVSEAEPFVVENKFIHANSRKEETMCREFKFQIH